MKKSLLLGLLFTATCKPVLDLNLENRSLSNTTKTQELPRRTNVLTRIACLDDLARKPRPANWIRELQKRETSGKIRANFRNKYNDDLIFYLLDKDYSYQKTRTSPNKYAFSNNNLIICSHNRVSILDEATGNMHTLNHGEYILDSKISSDNRLVLTVSTSTIRVWNADTDECLGTLDLSGFTFSRAQFSPTNKLILTSDENTAKVWDFNEGKCIITLKHDALVTHAQFSSDSRLILTVSNNVAKIWDAYTGQCVKTLNHDALFTHAQFSSDSRVILTVSNNVAKIWDAYTGQCVKTLNHDAPVAHAQFSSDSRLILTGSGNTIRLWDACTHECLKEFTHDSRVTSAQFSSDNGLILTLSVEDGTKLWNTHTGECLQTLKHTDRIVAAQFSPDNRLILTHSYRSTDFWHICKSTDFWEIKPNLQKAQTSSIYLPLIALGGVITGITIIGFLNS